MMYELQIAAKYLNPRWKQLSVSIISLVSILVIAVTVWLIVVFFSVTSGLTNSWIDKLIALTAPVRITPTSDYYHSYYYLVDGISAQSDYTLKSIEEKRFASESDPYDPLLDEEIPPSWQSSHRLADGSLVDPVKLAFAEIDQLKGLSGLSASDYQMTVGNLNLRLLREGSVSLRSSSDQDQNLISQASYFGSLDPYNTKLLQAVMPLTPADLSNILSTLSIKSEDLFNKLQIDDVHVVRERLKSFFSAIHVEELKTAENGWLFPSLLLPIEATWNVLVVKRKNIIQRLLIPLEKKIFPLQTSADPEIKIEPAQLIIANGNFLLKQSNEPEQKLPPHVQLYLQGNVQLPAKLIEESISRARDASSLRFEVNFNLQGYPIQGNISYGPLKIGRASFSDSFQKEISPFWLYQNEGQELSLPVEDGRGDGILLPKGFRSSGILVGDRGYISYFSPTLSALQEQQVPIFVAGFYDPGIIPIGAKYVLTSKPIATLMQSFPQDQTLSTNGINVRFDDPDQAEHVKKELEERFQENGIAPYWKIETFREYEFTRDILRQLQSEKRLFSLLAALIILVACSNIISMLIILVNDKKLEIGILRSMGANSLSIAFIFGTCGMVMGLMGSLIGTAAAIITLKNIQPLVDFIGRLQGHEMFNPLFYGDVLPTEISFEAISFVVIATALTSLAAGLIPAIKASLLKPAAILKAE